MRKSRQTVRSSLNLARKTWPDLGRTQLAQLKELGEKHHLSVLSGDVLYLEHRWYVTHTGLLRLAQRRRCAGIRVRQVREFCDPSVGRWVFQATVYKSSGSMGFVGYGDADPSNTSPLVRGAEMRVAETRAVNRALRKAYGSGLCSVEELGSLTGGSGPSREWEKRLPAPPHNGSGNGQPRLRDRLCLLIRQHHLDAALVKRYAADFCGTENLRDAGRDRVESFINHLAEWAGEDREALLCKLSSYAQPQEAAS